MAYYLAMGFIMLLGMVWAFFSDQIKGMMQTPTTPDSDQKDKTKSNRIIVHYKGNRYDVTDFVKRHPGGKEVLMENNGKDVEQLMLENKHSIHAYTTLAKYKI